MIIRRKSEKSGNVQILIASNVQEGPNTYTGKQKVLARFVHLYNLRSRGKKG
jgi:hypothetical protein